MNGWIRIGIVMSVLWFSAIAIYGGYEYRSHSINPELQCKFYDDDCKAEIYKRKFFFVESVMGRRKETLPQWQLDNANTLLAEKKLDKETLDIFLNEFVSWSSFNSSFYLALIAPILAGWAVAFAALHLVRWISDGFNSKESS